MSRHDQRTLLDRLTIIEDKAELDALIDRILTAKKSLTIAFVNQHAFNLYACDSAFRQALTDADIVLRDGIGMCVVLRALGLSAGLNMNGTDFIPSLARTFAQRAPQCSVHAYGTVSPWLERGAQVLFADFFSVPVLRHGFLTEKDYVECLQADNNETKFVMLAMGMPKQEMVAAALKHAVNDLGVIVCGGAILDFCAEKMPRAPRWVRALRMEWLFRLMMEPRRLFSRYVVGGIAFFKTLVLLVIDERSRVKSRRIERVKASS